jgi:hypothetical protein
VIAMIIDCHSCPVRDLHCDDCMVTALLTQDAALPLDPAERAAVTRLVASGLVSAERAGAATARREPWGLHASAVG